jgi:hypothetical protein
VLSVVIELVHIIITVLLHVMDANVFFGVPLNNKLNMFVAMKKIVTLLLMPEMHVDFVGFNVALMLECNLNLFV